jgi:hypothetical protein
MFVDEKKTGEAQTRADPFSLDSLIAWLEKQPAEKEYSTDPVACVLAQYLGGFCGGREEEKLIGNNLYVIFGEPRTFGGFLSRARALRK